MLRVVSALRRITQAMDSHSKWLDSHVQLTVPQLLVLEALREARQPTSTGVLATRVSLTQGTLTSILDRLEGKQLVTRERAVDDRRRVLVALTPHGNRTLKRAPPLMDQAFSEAFSGLPEAERETLTRALERVAELMRPLPSGTEATGSKAGTPLQATQRELN